MPTGPVLSLLIWPLAAVGKLLQHLALPTNRGFGMLAVDCSLALLLLAIPLGYQRLDEQPAVADCQEGVARRLGERRDITGLNLGIELHGIGDLEDRQQP